MAITKLSKIKIGSPTKHFLINFLIYRDEKTILLSIRSNSNVTSLSLEKLRWRINIVDNALCILLKTNFVVGLS